MSKFNIPERVIYVCVGSKCEKRGGKSMYKKLKSYRGVVEIIKTDCTDRCEYAPVLSIQPDNIWLKEYSEKTVIKTLEEVIKP